MFSSGAGDLESALRDVEPILRGNGDSQFTHPSFREILAARQFADEINSGKLSVRDAYMSLCKTIDWFPKLGNFTILWPSLRLVLNHLPSMLDDKAAIELINTISETYFSLKDRIESFSVRDLQLPVLDDLELCARFIGDHPSLHSDERVRQIIDVLMEVVYENCEKKSSFEYCEDPLYNLAEDALIKTKSSYAATKLLEFNIFLGHLSVREYSSHCQENLKLRASIALESIVKKGAKIYETVLIKSFHPLDLKCLNSSDISFLLDYGGIKSFRHVMEMLAASDDLLGLGFGNERDFFGFLLQGIKKYEFEPKMIGHFNNVVSKCASNNFVMNNYHNSLSSFAKFFKPLFGKDLYDYLAAKGIQFFNSEVYKPK